MARPSPRLAIVLELSSLLSETQAKCSANHSETLAKPSVA